VELIVQTDAHDVVGEMCFQSYWHHHHPHSIASHMTELGEELLSYHRDEDYKIIRLRDDLISAVR
jgi:hypothetical protein